MSLNTQAIVPGHLALDEICQVLISAANAKILGTVPRYSPDTGQILLRDHDGVSLVLEVFLNSYAATDYADAFQGPSTLIVCQYQPATLVLMTERVTAQGGLVRKYEGQPWITPPSSPLA